MHRNLFFRFFPMAFFLLLLLCFLFFFSNGICLSNAEKLTVIVRGQIRAFDVESVFGGDPSSARALSVAFTGPLPGRGGNSEKAFILTKWFDEGDRLIQFTGKTVLHRNKDVERRLAYALLRSARNAGRYGALLSEWGPPVQGATYALYIGGEKISLRTALEISAKTLLNDGCTEVTLEAGTVQFASQIENCDDDSGERYQSATRDDGDNDRRGGTFASYFY